MGDKKKYRVWFNVPHYTIVEAETEDAARGIASDVRAKDLISGWVETDIAGYDAQDDVEEVKGSA
jgi:hypothetical protein